MRERLDISDRCCDECGLPEEGFAFYEDRCMLPICPKCSFLLQLYGIGCGNVRVYYLCRNCYENRIERGFAKPWQGGELTRKRKSVG